MRRNILTVSKPQRIAAICAFIMLMTFNVSAQNSQGTLTPQPQTEPTPQAKPTPSLESRFLRNILNDQYAIWTAPFRIGRGDMKMLGPLVLSTAALMATDRYTGGEIIEGNHSTRLRISKDISYGGSVYATGGIAATFYLAGRATNNRRARETGLLSAEALVDSSIVVEVLKAASQRPRPLVDDASGEFFDGGNSFPSGHAISAWSVATVVAYEYGEHRPLVRFGAYGLASAVSISRYTGQKHFLSDVLVGSAFGYGIGRYVYRTHHDASLDEDAGAQMKNRSKLIPLTSPLYSRASHAYGLALAWDF
ncbi:MAG TPA: phosphatase PAP2 family protein [Pyrinomonadaceae bacterium]